MTTTAPLHPVAADRADIRSRAARVVRWLAGALLIIAAAAKTYELGTQPVLAGRNVFIALVIFQWLLGVLLILGIFPRWIWPVTIATYLTFTGVSAYQAVQGADSCGCFGQAMRIHPLIMVGVDLGVVLAMTAIWPGMRDVNSGRISRCTVATLVTD